VVVALPLPFALVADKVTVTDSGARAVSAASAALGSVIVNVNARSCCPEPRLAGSEKVLRCFLPCLGLTTSVSLPRNVRFAAWSQRTTNDSVPGLRWVLTWWAFLLVGAKSTVAVFERIVHDGLGEATTVPVGEAALAGAATVPESTSPPLSPIRQNTFGEQARPVITLFGSTKEADQVVPLNGGVVEVSTSPAMSPATHSELVGHASSVIRLSGSILAEGADQFTRAKGALAVSTRPSESIATHEVLDGHASSVIVDVSMLKPEELQLDAPKGGVEDVYTFPLASIATHAVLDGHARAEMKLPPAIDAGVDQLAAANGGADELKTFPLKSVATQTPLDGQSSAEIPLASILDEGADHVEPPPAGLADVRTEPLLSNATHALLDAHARLKIPPPLGSTSAAFHAAVPPVGSVEVRIRPAPSLPTHRPLDGHDCPNSSTGSSPGATSRGVLHVADAPFAASAEVDTWPPDVPATHNEAEAPVQAKASVGPEARSSDTHVAPPSVETSVVLPSLEKQITPGALSAESGAHVGAKTGTLGVDTVHVGVVSPGLVLVAIWLPNAVELAAMQNVVVGHENPVMELSPVEEEFAEVQDDGEPGLAELRTEPSLLAMKHIVADGHALATAPARVESPTSPPVTGTCASDVAHTSPELLVATQTVVEAPAAHEGGFARVEGANLCTAHADAPPVGFVDLRNTLLSGPNGSAGFVPTARQNGSAPWVTQLTPNST
jgi:hypothetical protein